MTAGQGLAEGGELHRHLGGAAQLQRGQAVEQGQVGVPRGDGLGAGRDVLAEVVEGDPQPLPGERADAASAWSTSSPATKRSTSRGRLLRVTAGAPRCCRPLPGAPVEHRPPPPRRPGRAAVVDARPARRRSRDRRHRSGLPSSTWMTAVHTGSRHRGADTAMRCRGGPTAPGCWRTARCTSWPPPATTTSSTRCAAARSCAGSSAQVQELFAGFGIARADGPLRIPGDAAAGRLPGACRCAGGRDLRLPVAAGPDDRGGCTTSARGVHELRSHSTWSAPRS